jgi:hypothetical protein
MAAAEDPADKDMYLAISTGRLGERRPHSIVLQPMSSTPAVSKQQSTRRATLLLVGAITLLAQGVWSTWLPSTPSEVVKLYT